MGIISLPWVPSNYRLNSPPPPFFLAFLQSPSSILTPLAIASSLFSHQNSSPFPQPLVQYSSASFVTTAALTTASSLLWHLVSTQPP